MVRKRTMRSWFIHRMENQLDGLNMSRFHVLIGQDEGVVQPGTVRLSRLVGCVNFWLLNAPAGEAAIHLWHGAILGDADETDYQVLQNDANDGSWLWREPIAMWRNSLAAADDVKGSQLFDWPIRGGKGSNLSVSTAMYYIITLEGQLTGVQVNYATKALALYEATQSSWVP